VGHDGPVPPLDHDRCYAAAASRDARFDGHFVTAVKTTGIYCRPSCPAITPKRTNVEFHATAAAAQQRGFRACKRCLPDATPGSPEWNLRRDLVGRAMRLIADGELDRSGVGGLAARLGYSERHLSRVVTDELGAGPLAIARARRAHTARLLIETTPMRLTDIAFAAGFGSVRQFNDTIREVYDASPTDLRAAAIRRNRGAGGPGPLAAEGEAGRAPPLRLRLPVREPFAGDELVDWFAARAIPGLEAVTATGASTWSIERAIRLPGGAADVRIEVGIGEPSVVAAVVLDDPSDLSTLVERLRRLLDLDADPVAIDGHLGDDSLLRPLIEARPGLRSPGSLDGFETGVRTIVGQQVSVAGARTVLARLVDACAVNDGDDLGRPMFPTAADVADAPDEAFSMPSRRRDTIRRFAAAIASGELVLDAGTDPAEARQLLLDVPGIGPWTADYIALRALRDPDVALLTDLVAARAAVGLGVPANELEQRSARWSPWRTYATHHLWAHAGSTTQQTSAHRSDQE